MRAHSANPLRTRLIAKSRMKHDTLDTLMLAELLKSGYLPEAYRAPDDVNAIRMVIRERGPASERTGRSRARPLQAALDLADTEATGLRPMKNSRLAAAVGSIPDFTSPCRSVLIWPSFSRIVG